MTQHLRFAPGATGRGGWDLPGLGRLSFLDDSGAEVGSYTADGALASDGPALVVGGYLAVADAEARRRRQAGAIAAAAANS